MKKEKRDYNKNDKKRSKIIIEPTIITVIMKIVITKIILK